MTNVVDEILEEFPHRPDGMIARHLRHEEQREQAKAEHSTVTESGRDHVKAVRVMIDAGDLCTPSMKLLSSANPIDMILPLDPHRRNAIILAVDNDVYLVTDKGAGLNIAGSNTGTQGFYLPAGIALPFECKAAVWAAVTTTNTGSRVSVMSFRESA